MKINQNFLFFFFFSISSVAPQQSKSQMIENINTWYENHPDKYSLSLNGSTASAKVTRYHPERQDEKNDLIEVTKKVFNFFVKDPSNINEDYKRTRVRKLLKSLEKEGLDKKKFKLTIDNLKISDESIKFYVNKNLIDNSVLSKKKNVYILNDNFFNQSYEIIFRSLIIIIQKLGKKYYPVRGKSINELIKRISEKSITKTTLGGCFIERANKTILISKENSRKV